LREFRPSIEKLVIMINLYSFLYYFLQI